MEKQPVLYIVIPCYNEQEVLPITSGMFRDKLRQLAGEGKISPDSRVLFVNDGSKDNTWAIIQKLAEEDACFEGICLSRNRGHQNALLAGLMEARTRCDITISIDCDGQDDINAMDAMVDAWHEGCEVVYGVRAKRDTDTWFKRTTAEGFYHIMNAMGAKVVFNHADYRLLSRRALDELAHYKEVNLFLRGIVPMIGYRTDVVTYERGERFAGESKYPLKKMLAFALEGITSLSVKPLRLITGLGFFVFLVSLFMILYNVIRWVTGNTVTGWASISCSVWLIGGLILLALGVIGEYVGKLYMEAKGRPRFLVSDVVDEQD